MGYMFRIKDWHKHFEKMQSKRVNKLSWLPLPIKTSGNGYQRIWRLKNAVQVWAGWILLLQYAAMHDGIENRGNLFEDGETTDCDTISIKLSADYDCIVYALIATCASDYKIKWIEAKRIDEDDRKWRFLTVQELGEIFFANSANVAATLEVCTTLHKRIGDKRTEDSGSIKNAFLKTPESQYVDNTPEPDEMSEFLIEPANLEADDDPEASQIDGNGANLNDQDVDGTTVPEIDEDLPEAVQNASTAFLAEKGYVADVLSEGGWSENQIKEVLKSGREQMIHALASHQYTMDYQIKSKGNIRNIPAAAYSIWKKQSYPDSNILNPNNFGYYSAAQLELREVAEDASQNQEVGVE